MKRCQFGDVPRCDCAERTERFLKGDPFACDGLIENLKPLIWAIVRRILVSARHEECEDAVQEVLLKLFTGLGRWREDCPFCDWVALVASKKAIDLRRRARSRIATVSLPSSEIAAQGSRASSSEPDLGSCPERVLSEVEPRWRQAFDLTYKEGLPREQVAQMVGVAPRTLQYWLAEILERIRTCVQRL
jgi:RNA polymerase sigma factor (sigma-70 family)